ncbi:MAG: DUF4116 domain-containing protein [Legionella sp.]|nr:DUF4116 domain-containing protein [Legionella sp.]
MAGKKIVDRKKGLFSVLSNGLALKNLSKTLKNDKEIVLSAVKQTGLALQYASDELKADRKTVFSAVKNTASALEYASDWLKCDRSIVFLALKQNGQTLKYAADRLRRDEKIVLAAVHQDGLALEHALGDIKNNKKVVLAAVAQDSRALQFASKKLRADREVIAAAAKHQNTYAAVNTKLNQAQTRSKSFDSHPDKKRVLKALEIHEHLYQLKPDPNKHGFYDLSYVQQLKAFNQMMGRVNRASRDETDSQSAPKEKKKMVIRHTSQLKADLKKIASNNKPNSIHQYRRSNEFFDLNLEDKLKTIFEGSNKHMEDTEKREKNNSDSSTPKNSG